MSGVEEQMRDCSDGGFEREECDEGERVEGLLGSNGNGENRRKKGR